MERQYLGYSTTCPERYIEYEDPLVRAQRYVYQISRPRTSGALYRSKRTV